MICVFDVIEGPARGKRFWLRQDERIEIGRISTADFSVPADHHMSRHHLIVEATVGAFRVRDVGSANGTYVNNSKVSALELCSGDKIRAGSSTFAVSLISDDTSPHAADGLSLDGGVPSSRSMPPAAPSNRSDNVGVPQRSVHMPMPPEPLATNADFEDTQKLYSVASLLNSVAKLSSAADGSAVSNGSAIGSGSVGSSGSVAMRGSNAGSNAGSAVANRLSRSGTSSADVMATELQSETWVGDFFVPTKVPQLFHEGKKFVDGDMNLIDLLQTLDDRYRLSVVLNVPQLGRLASEVLENWRSLSRVLELSPKLCLLTSDGSSEFWTLIRNSLQRDAVIVFGSLEPLQNAWLHNVLELLLSPATLNELLSASTEHLRNEMLSQADFILFEQDPSGRLALLTRV